MSTLKTLVETAEKVGLTEDQPVCIAGGGLVVESVGTRVQVHEDNCPTCGAKRATRFLIVDLPENLKIVRKAPP